MNYENYQTVILARHRHPHRTAFQTGFSLIEALVSLTIIGIIVSIALGWFTGARRDVIERVTNQRNAQEIVAMGVYATVSGAAFVEPGDKFATVQNLLQGTTGTVGIWKDQTFRLSTLEPSAIPDALPYVNFEGDLLMYDPAGGQM